jgi:60 kDa SS-A/Ro ribonucleoprotein
MTKHLAQIYGAAAASAQNVQDSEDQVQNNAGGFVFQADDWKRLERFLILGTEGGTYYVGEQKHARDNAKVVERCLKADGIRTVKTIVDVSQKGRAPKNDYALFALAMAASFGNAETKAYALANLPAVARIGTHLFTFTQFVEGMRKWSRGLRNAYRDWYFGRKPDRLAYQLIKYQSRKIEGQPGWSHDDILRKAHITPKAGSPNAAVQHELLQYVSEGWEGINENGLAVVRACINRAELYKVKGKGVEKQYKTYLLEIPEAMKVIEGFERAKRETDPKKVAKLIADYGLTREMIPTEVMKSSEVWEALLVNMPYTAMIRNLGNMSKAGILGPNSDGAIKVITQLGSRENLKKARIHPIQVLAALLTYKQGHSSRGYAYGKTDKTWDVNDQIVGALDTAFYLSFDTVPRTNKRFFIGQDISGSMTAEMGNIPGMTCAMASAAMAMTTVRTEPFLYYAGFSTHLTKLGITSNERLDSVLNKISNKTFGGTDCSKPMVEALQMKMPVDVFAIYTDNETWAGSIKPHQALTKYRDKMGIPAKLVVVGMTSTGFTIADPKDSGSLDVVGFDTGVPTLLADFVSDGQVANKTEEVAE